jgi:hypothetical protein
MPTVVPTAAAPGALKANVYGVWTDVIPEEIHIGKTDPMPSDPTIEMWYTPTVEPPPVPPVLWDPTVTYAAGDYSLWPNVEPWLANRVTVGEEPGVIPPPIDTSGIQFLAGGITAGTNNLPISTTFEIVLNINGSLGTTGHLFVIYNRFTLMISGSDLLFRLTVPGVGMVDMIAPIASFGSDTWIKVIVRDNDMEFQRSPNGMAWTSVTALPGPGANLAGGLGGNTQIGFDGSSNYYNGGISSVEMFSVAGGTRTVVQSWVYSTQPGPLGTGVSPKTGETYTVVGTVTEIPGAVIPVPPAWDAVPVVPTTTTKGVLRANVNGTWETVFPAGTGATGQTRGTDIAVEELLSKIAVLEERVATLERNQANM